MAETVFNVEAAKSYIKRFTNAVVFGKTGVTISSTADKSIFFSKVPLSSSHMFLVEIYDSSDAKVGSINFSFTAGKVSYADSCITVLGASSQEMISQTKIIASFNFEDQEDTSHVLIGLKLSTYGNLKLTYQVVSSNRAVVTPIALSHQALVNYKEYDVSKGYLLDRALFEETDVLNAFRRWSSTHQYSGNDPVFYGSHLYYASPNSVPAVGEDPTHYPSKWIELATAEIPDTDITKGAETPQLFYHNSLVISNGTAAELRRDHKDVGFEYPSKNSKVYHFDEDLLDQNQENSLTDFIQIPQDPEIRPFFVGKGMVGVGISSDPAILFKPLKENPAFYYGNFSIQKTLKLNTENNMFGFHFKYSGIQNFVNEKIIELTFASGEKISLMINYSEPDYMEDAELPYWDPEEIPSYSQPKTSTPCLTVLTEFNESSAVEIFPQYPLIEDSWAHLCIEIQSHSITFFFRGQQITLPRKSSGLGNVQYYINKNQKAFSIDELIWDTTTKISYARYQELTSDSLPWAAHEKSENWLSIHVQNDKRIDVSPLLCKDSVDNGILADNFKVVQGKTLTSPLTGTLAASYVPFNGLCSILRPGEDLSFICNAEYEYQNLNVVQSVYDIVTLHRASETDTEESLMQYLREMMSYNTMYNNWLPMSPGKLCNDFARTAASAGLMFKSFNFSDEYIANVNLAEFVSVNGDHYASSADFKIALVNPQTLKCFCYDLMGTSYGEIFMDMICSARMYWAFMGFKCRTYDYQFLIDPRSEGNSTHNYMTTEVQDDSPLGGTWHKEFTFWD